MTTANFNYQGDRAGYTLPNYEFEIEDLTLDGHDYCLNGSGDASGYTLKSAEIWNGEAWVPVEINTVPATWREEVADWEQSCAEKAWERHLDSFYG